MPIRASIFFVLFLTACSSAAEDRVEENASSLAAAAVLSTELDFQPGWLQTQHGAVVRGGHVNVVYATSRLSKCAAPTIFSYARFLPSGQLFSSDEALAFDVPSDATSVDLWFHAVAPDCDEWDSNYGQNWSFPVLASAPSDIGWAGDWGSSTSRACEHDAGVPEPITIDEYMRERSCIFVDVDVWVPGVTDVASPHPEWIQAHSTWSKDGGAPVVEWLAYQGIVGHNARFRWTIPYAIRDQANWNTVNYAFDLSSDGVHTTHVAQPSGEDRTIVRAFSFSSSSP